MTESGVEHVVESALPCRHIPVDVESGHGITLQRNRPEATLDHKVTKQAVAQIPKLLRPMGRFSDTEQAGRGAQARKEGVDVCLKSHTLDGIGLDR